MAGSWRKNKRLLNKRAVIKGTFPSDIDFAPEEADQFLDYVIDESVMANNARVVKMAKEKKTVRSVGLADAPILHPAGNFDATKYHKTVRHNKLDLEVEKARGCVYVYDDDLEDGIEGDAFTDHLLRMVAAQVSNELDEAFWNGNKSPDSETPLVIGNLWDGWRYRVMNETHTTEGAAQVLDARSGTDFAQSTGYIAEQDGSAPYNWEFKFAKMLKKLPSKFKKRAGGVRNLRYFTNDEIVADYVSSLTTRGTAGGDQAILGQAPIQYGSVPIVECALMPTDLPVIVGTTPGDTTVDADSAAGQKVLNVAATTNFTAGDHVFVSKVGLEYKSEVLTIASVQSGVSLTMTTDLEWAHTLAHAETVEESTLDGADCLLTTRENLVIGLHRALKMETERKPEDEATLFWFSIRADVIIECVAAAVILHGLKVR